MVVSRMAASGTATNTVMESFGTTNDTQGASKGFTEFCDDLWTEEED